ncbi:hypothetical protein GA0074692_5321 [Micromonospora pallida]|uniref:Uncharacterized protein n=1 Tax=Micromonospora pallida TaxID=145854 RepID=A0A1C6TCC7_9ACTN|nr:hypothetical protein GA0074692_5321 [Micromonospora pallida]
MPSLVDVWVLGGCSCDEDPVCPGWPLQGGKALARGKPADCGPNPRTGLAASDTTDDGPEVIVVAGGALLGIPTIVGAITLTLRRRRDNAA